MQNKRISVLITGVGLASVGNQIVKALKSSKTQYWIVGTDIVKEVLY